jgi:hypothetical protein
MRKGKLDRKCSIHKVAIVARGGTFRCAWLEVKHLLIQARVSFQGRAEI